MTLKAFLSDRFRRVVLQGIFMLTALSFLLATGTAPGVAALLLIAALVYFTLTQVYDYRKCQRRLKELNAVMDGLNEKYLFGECAPPPKDAFERALFALFRRSGKSMIETVSDARAAGREYREYVESWVHEIKTPITATTLICRNMGGENKDKLLRELGQIEAHVERALFYARAESPEKDCLIRQCSLHQIVSDAIKNHQTLLIGQGVRIETEGFESRESEYPVYTDAKWASFIIGQILQNAARYHGEEPVISLTAMTLGKQVRLSIKDNGIGIPAHELPRVFDRGFTGKNGRARGGSTGMGLYLCRRLTAFLQMDLKITSTEGMGTEVSLTFPSKENLTKL
ncbi:MAG: HAMP domain-containing histidine kinase [Lachnospiraceae bacterium]|jgi:signal transduction histidine kinase|nr:HAMP domain-containing histidine kinase [Lachnospiraceae bacterium]